MGLEDLKNKNDNKLDYDERLFLLTKKEEIACCIEELISDIYQENLSRTDSICI
ncbi:MAG: hypothetical protein Q8O99_00825 [bacterium]|nr:hypothetical protein [bacterium]